MLYATKEMILRDIEALPPDYKTKDIDALIRRYVKEHYDMSALRSEILTEQRLHRIYFYTSLKQLKSVYDRAAFIDNNLLFSDWWHTDQLIRFVSALDYETARRYSEKYLQSADLFVRRWGYVLWISKLCRDGAHVDELLSLMKNDDAYYVQMAQAWLIAELAIFFPEQVRRWMEGENTLSYSINGKAIQKICDSFRISAENKERFKALRSKLKERVPA
ncbi:MAG: DNA alkylation repair protein [Ruminococcus sp.]|nr:DNA alkylation repair protein [Ruminococcus sp.]